MLSNWASEWILSATKWNTNSARTQTATTARACRSAPVYYRHIYKYGLPKFKRFATEVMGVSAEAKTDEEIALAGIEALEDFIVEIGLPVSLQDLGVNENTDLKEIADSCALMPGSYKK